MSRSTRDDGFRGDRTPGNGSQVTDAEVNALIERVFGAIHSGFLDADCTNCRRWDIESPLGIADYLTGPPKNPTEGAWYRGQIVKLESRY